MKIALISDTHDNLVTVRRAVDLFNRRNVGFMIHCGDYVAPFSLKPFADLQCDWRGVFGNNDGEKEGLTRVSQGRIVPGPCVLNCGRLIIGVTHILEETSFSSGPEPLDVIVFGHTHETEVRKKDVLLLNPGEAGGWVNGRSTVMILDSETLIPEIIELD